MAYRVKKRIGRGGSNQWAYKLGGPGYGWEVDTQWYDNDPQYKGALDEMMGLGSLKVLPIVQLVILQILVPIVLNIT